MSANGSSTKLAVPLLSLVLVSSGGFCHGRKGSQSPPSNSEVGHWRTFRSQKNGFEVKYPPGFVVSNDSAGYIVFSASHTDARFGLTISTPRQRGKMTLVEFVHDDTAYEEDHSYSYAGESVVSREGMMIYRFQRILGSSTRQGNFFLKDRHEGTMADYLIEYDQCNGGACGEGEHTRNNSIRNPYTKQYDEILSTFRFIAPAASDGGQ